MNFLSLTSLRWEDESKYALGKWATIKSENTIIFHISSLLPQCKFIQIMGKFSKQSIMFLPKLRLFQREVHPGTACSKCPAVAAFYWQLLRVLILVWEVVVAVHVHWVILCLWNVAPSRHIVHPPGDVWVWRGNDTDRENRRTLRKICPSATLSTTNPTWNDLGMNPGLHGERLTSNCLSHGTALFEKSDEHAHISNKLKWQQILRSEVQFVFSM
jgi:hypothetical protein